MLAIVKNPYDNHVTALVGFRQTVMEMSFAGTTLPHIFAIRFARALPAPPDFNAFFASSPFPH